MRTIHKFKLDPKDLNVFMPVDAKILSVAGQHGHICLWAEVDDTDVTQQVGFEVFGTGHEIDEMVSHEREFLGTAILHDGDLVFHVYRMV